MLDKGKLTTDEIVKICEDHENTSKSVFALLTELHYADQTTISEIETSKIEELWYKPILVGGNSRIDGIEMTNDENNRRTVRNCREYKDALEAGYDPLTNFDLKMSVTFKHQSDLLTAISNSIPPENSFISKPRVGVVDLNLLPADLFIESTFLAEEVNSNRVKSGKSYQDLIDEGELSINSATQRSIVVEGNGMGQFLLEVARSDFTGDGLEDILVFEYCFAIGGTLGYGDTWILTRKNAHERFEAHKVSDLI